MSLEDLHEGIRRLRAVELRRAVRGVDTEWVRNLLDESVDYSRPPGARRYGAPHRRDRPRCLEELEAFGSAGARATESDLLADLRPERAPSDVPAD